MIPIFEQGSGRGIGHSLESFAARFDQICAEHLKNKRASAFAFIFYDRHDEALRQLLHEQGVFTQLDRLAGKSLSVFFLHTGSDKALQLFNEGFLTILGVEESAITPCVVFFTLRSSDRIDNVRVVSLDQADLVHGFHELYQVIQDYIAGNVGGGQRHLRWVRTSGEFVGLEVLRAAIRKVLALFVF